jgi:hypothetical protein
MSAQDQKMSVKQERAVLAVLQHLTLAAAAKAVGVSEVTLRRWQQQPAF